MTAMLTRLSFRLLKFSLLMLMAAVAAAQPNLEVYPTHWWPGMQWNKVQLIVKSQRPDFSQRQVSVNYPGVTLDQVSKVDNGKYLILDLTIAPNAQPGNVPIRFTGRTRELTEINWPLKPRRTGKGVSYAKGVNSSDLIYLIMPDRFANGDPSNDRIPGMLDQTLNRNEVFDRHGGDLQGIINHLGYLQDLGVTALWLNPVIENDRPYRTEHGYAFTNHYRIDRRLGGDAKYRELIDSLHGRGMKMVQDAVYNHVDLNHILVKDLPAQDWLNQWPRHTNTTYKDQTLMDPYAARVDAKLMSDGWFTPEMPDWNHRNPYVANYLIQHALWTVEEFGVDAWRIDTYAYNDLEFMNRCNKALLDEYPNLHLFGETWVHGVVNQAFFCENNFTNLSFRSNLPSVTDFQTHMYGIGNAVNEPFGWTNGVNRLYNTLANDFVYKDPMKLVIFLDNHDKNRFFSEVGEDIRKMRVGMAWLMTCRGIPQLYYGIEVLMPGLTSPNDGHVRKDFPGGWPGDAKNGFTGQGLTQQEREFQQYTRRLANFRKSSSALTRGRMMQFVPEEGIYVYFRYSESETVMVVMNTNSGDKPLKLDRFAERTTGFSSAQEVTSGERRGLQGEWQVPGMTCWVLKLHP